MTLLLGLAIRSAVLVLVGLAVAAVLHRQSAALRHAVLAMTIVASAAVLPLTAIVPAWRVSWPASHEPPRMAAPAAVSTTPAPRTIAVSTAPARPAVSLAQLARVIWAAGFAVCAAGLLTGLARLAWIARRARRVRDGEWVRVASRVQVVYRLPRPVTILRTGAPDVLATFGIRQHRVLLPVHATAWSPDRIHAVLSHELAHVRRQDWLVQMGAELLRCVYWFNPLMWIACARLRRESECACDDVVLGCGMVPRDYAAHLLELARVCRHPRRVTVSAIPMARASTLERRITVMLNPAVNHTSGSNRARVAAAALLACLSLSVAAVRAGDGPQNAPTPVAPTLTAPGSGLATPDVLPPKAQSLGRRAITQARRVAVAPPAAIDRMPAGAAVSPAHGVQSAAPLGGSIYDASGGVIPGVNVTLRDAQQVTLTAVTDAAGRFQFSSVAPGTYALEAALPGFRTLRQNLELRTGQDWERVITLQLGQLSETVVVSAPRVASSVGGSQAQPTRLKVGGNVRAPRKLVDSKPVYPDSMRDAGREAAVSLDAVIGTDGSVTSVRVISADIHPDFAIAAAEAVRQWKFDPTRLNGMAVEVQMTVTVEFRLLQ